MVRIFLRICLISIELCFLEAIDLIGGGIVGTRSKERVSRLRFRLVVWRSDLIRFDLFNSCPILQVP